MAEASITLDLADRTREADHPHSLVARFSAGNPLRLDAGIDFSPLQIAYQTYGTLNPARSNAVLICHALTGDQHADNDHPVTGKPGWWETVVGSGRPIDTERYFVICPNVVGGCMGTSGPASKNPATGEPWGLDFPVITVRDMVRAHQGRIWVRSNGERGSAFSIALPRHVSAASELQRDPRELMPRSATRAEER